MARIAGIDIPRDKRVEVALTYIYGVGLARSQTILAKSGVNPDIRVKDLEDGDVQKLRSATEAFTIEGEIHCTTAPIFCIIPCIAPTLMYNLCILCYSGCKTVPNNNIATKHITIRQIHRAPLYRKSAAVPYP